MGWFFYIKTRSTVQTQHGTNTAWGKEQHLRGYGPCPGGPPDRCAVRAGAKRVPKTGRASTESQHVTKLVPLRLNLATSSPYFNLVNLSVQNSSSVEREITNLFPVYPRGWSDSVGVSAAQSLHTAPPVQRESFTPAGYGRGLSWTGWRVKRCEHFTIILTILRVENLRSTRELYANF